MNIETLTETKRAATEKWHEYKNAEKVNKDPMYKDLRKVYNQIKNGKKVIDIFKVIQKGDVHANFHPKLAIAKALTKNITCKYYQDGTVKFLNDRNELAADVILKNCLPTFKMQRTWDFQILQAPVPIVPPKFLPKILTDDYYILWEVDEWKQVPPTDPFLLKRITTTLFVVLAGWDLTELEKAVMAGRMLK